MEHEEQGHLAAPTEREAPPDHLTLKWGTLKSWRFSSERARELLQRYNELGASMSAMLQHDSPEQKQIICELIDECKADTIYLDWDGRDVSKDEAKEYVLNYGKPQSPNP